MLPLLIVEDEEKMRCAISLAFTQRGFCVETANSLATARKLLINKQYALFILDIGLPDGSGIDLAREILRNPQHKKTHVVAFSAFPKEDYEERCLAAGFSDFLNKPLTEEKLNYLITTFLSTSDNSL
ncbi:MAG: response regulator [Gammaproteobacteria bacterium]